ncbi:hypothetical protein SAMN05421810_106275 [Amycolatopsis arida]|uniref:Uncharacterized protein n=1 Tax=Amycolatopsis arida TaxID=587909 RepID=A0A1I5XVH1_9PSEU|nr:hypothetical protein [Amycolatopsis arida]TDX97244.1 hypothetical protein CLV69_102347 [Amycolatopsis arida]SFQ35896.1 hypothetical protein SAMN05421810_106275 [Amycolatopsis arida]
MAADDKLNRLLRAWRRDIDSEPFPVFSDLLSPRALIPRQTRRRARTDQVSTGPRRHGERRPGRRHAPGQDDDRRR